MINLTITNLQTTPFWVGTSTKIAEGQSLVIREDFLPESVERNLRRAEKLRLIRVVNNIDDESDIAVTVESIVLTPAHDNTRLHLIRGYQTVINVNANTLPVGFRVGVTNDQAIDVPIYGGAGMVLVPYKSYVPANTKVDLVVTRPNRMLLAVPAGALDHDHLADGTPQWTGKTW